MSNVEKVRSNCHESGITRVAADGGLVLTGGVDGSVVLYQSQRWGPQATQVWRVSEHKAPVTGVDIRPKENRALSCARDGVVLFYSGIRNEGTAPLVVTCLCRVSGEIHCISFDEKANRCVVAGDTVRILTLPTAKDEAVTVVTVPLRVPFPILSVSISPCETYLAMVSHTGDISITDYKHALKPKSSTASLTQQQGEMNTQMESSLLKQLGAGQEKEFAQVLKGYISPTRKKDDICIVKLGWMMLNNAAVPAPPAPEASGVGQLLLAVPTAVGAAIFRLTASTVGQPSFQRVGSIHHDNLKDAVSVFLVPHTKRKFQALVASAEGYIGLYKVDNAKFAAEESVAWKVREGNYCGASLDSASGSLFYSTDGGAVTMLKSIVRGAHSGLEAAPKSQANEGAVQEEEADVAPTKPEKEKKHRKRLSSVSSDSDSEPSDGEDLDELVSDLVANGRTAGVDRASRHKESGHRRKRRVASDFFNLEASEGEESVSELAEDEPYRQMEGEDDDEDEEAEEAEELEPEPDAVPPQGALANQGIVGQPGLAPYTVQPGATAPRTEEGPCYLAYNSIGAILRTSDSCQILYHDVSRPTIRLPPAEAKRVTMAALGIRGAAFVLAKISNDVETADGLMKEQVDRPQELLIRSTDIPVLSDFRVALPAEEEIRCVATGKNFVAISTTFYLRIFTYGGLELVCIQAPQNVVALLGQNVPQVMEETEILLQDQLAVVYLVGSQHFVRIWDVARKQETLAPTELSLTVDKHTGVPLPLLWAGWSDTADQFYAADTAGVVRRLSHTFGKCWTPVFDPKHLSIPAGALWPWGVHGESLLVCACPNNDGNGPEASTILPPLKRAPLSTPFLPMGNEAATKRHLTYVRRMASLDELKAQSTFYTEEIAKGDKELDQETEKLFLHYLEENQLAKVVDCASMFQVNKHLTSLLKSNPQIQQNRVISAAMINEIERRRKVPRKKLCTLPSGGDSAVMNDAHRELLMKRLWEREAKEIEIELQQQKATKKGGAGQDGPSNSGVAAPAIPVNIYAQAMQKQQPAAAAPAKSALKPSVFAPAAAAAVVDTVAAQSKDAQQRKVDFQTPHLSGLSELADNSVVQGTTRTAAFQAPHRPIPVETETLSTQDILGATLSHAAPALPQKPKNPFSNAAAVSAPTSTAPGSKQPPTPAASAAPKKSAPPPQAPAPAPKPKRTPLGSAFAGASPAKAAVAAQPLPRSLGLAPAASTPRKAALKDADQESEGHGQAAVALLNIHLPSSQEVNVGGSQGPTQTQTLNDHSDSVALLGHSEGSGRQTGRPTAPHLAPADHAFHSKPAENRDPFLSLEPGPQCDWTKGVAMSPLDEDDTTQSSPNEEEIRKREEAHAKKVQEVLASVVIPNAEDEDEEGVRGNNSGLGSGLQNALRKRQREEEDEDDEGVAPIRVGGLAFAN